MKMINSWYGMLVVWTCMLLIVLAGTEAEKIRGNNIVRNNNGIIKNRDLSTSSSSSCGEITFAVYNVTSNTSTTLRVDQYFSTYPKGRILLDQYPNGTISIIANVDTSMCSTVTTVRCVKMTFGNFQLSIEGVIPYTLYGDNITSGQIIVRKPKHTGFQLLTATAYSTGNCTGIPIIETINDIHLVPKSIASIRSIQYNAVYNGTSGGIPTKKDTHDIVNVTCQFIRESLSYGFTYKGSLSHDYSSFKCFRVVTKSLPTTTTIGNNTTNTTSSVSVPLQISYKIIATFRISQYISTYLNQDMPTTEQLSKYITDLFLDRISVGPGTSTRMSDYIRDRIPLSNVYSNFTNILL